MCVVACRLGARGLQAVAADPGAVRTNIYNNSPKLGRGFIKTMIDNCYAPPEDGAQVGANAVSVLHMYVRGSATVFNRITSSAGRCVVL
jgi:hypothetical protein